MEKQILERVKEVIEVKYDGNQAKLCREIDYNPSSLNNTLKRNGKPSVVLLVGILAKNREISAEWLLLGEGEMFKSKNNENQGDSVQGESDSRQEVAGLRKEIEYLKESNGQLKEINHLLKRQLEDLNSPSE